MVCLSDEAAASECGRRISGIFSLRASIAHIMGYEAALARVQARHGMVPASAAADITAKASLDHFPFDEWQRQKSRLGHPLVAILEAWMTRLEPESSEWLHYGATTADLFNTVLIVQLQQSGAVLVEQLQQIEERLAKLASRHRATPMVARTLGRHAQPFTFGMKVASWLVEHRRSIERLQAWLSRYRSGILSGAAGTYAAFADEGPAIERELMAELGLAEPEPVDWKGSRDRFAELGCAIALAARTCGHFAQEIFLLGGDDLDEVREISGAVGSSTMPHKSNPAYCIEVVSRSREVSARLQPLLEWIPIIYDRDSSQHGEWLRDMCVGMADLLACTIGLLDSLVVMPANMERNLRRTDGLILSEAMTFALAGKVGKHTAHSEVKRLVAIARERGCSLQEAMLGDETAASLLIERPELGEVTRYIGRAAEIVDAATAGPLIDPAASAPRASA